MEHKEPHGRGGGRNEVGAGRWDVEGSGDGRGKTREKKKFARRRRDGSREESKFKQDCWLSNISRVYLETLLVR